MLRTRGLYLLSRGKLDEALADLDRSLDIEPDDAATHQARGMALFGLKKFDAALASFQKVLEIAPELRAARWYRARVFRETGDYASALAEWDQLLEKKPNDLAALAQRAEIHFETGDFPSALADAESILEMREHYVPALILRAEALVQSKRIEEAIKSLADSVDEVPDQKNILLLQLARYYLVDRRADEAIKTLDQLLSENQDNWLALRIRGDALLAIGKQAPAIENYEAALKQRPEDSSTLNNLAWVLATSPDGDLRDGVRAVELATKACEATAYEEPHILSTLAAAYAEKGEFDSAVRWSEKAVELGKQADEGPHPQLDQLTAELASYREGKPWRERQSQEPRESPEPSAASVPEDRPETTVAPSPESNQDESDPHPPNGSEEQAIGEESP